MRNKVSQNEAAIQELSALMARLNFDPSRLTELTFEEFKVVDDGAAGIIELHFKKLSVATVQKVQELSARQETVNALLAILEDPSVTKLLRRYTEGLR